MRIDNVKIISKSGFFFTVDALLASITLLIGLILISSLYYYQAPTFSLDSYSSDFLSVLSSVRIKELNNQYVADLIADGTIRQTDLNNSVLEEIGKLYAEGNIPIARQLIINISEGLIPDSYGFGVYANTNTIYERNNTLQKSDFLISYSRMVSGINESRPTEGFSSRVFLTAPVSKSQFAYAYFGGLIGQGNITKSIDLPSNYSSITGLFLELDPGSNFSLFINGNASGHYTDNCTGAGFMRAKQCIIPLAYSSFFRPGRNMLTFVFDNSENAYISGGFFRVKLNTSELNFSEIAYNEALNRSVKIDYLSGVNGVINYYSSLYAAGHITSIEIFLNFSTTYPLYMTIGNTTVYDGSSANTTGNVTVMLNDSNMSGLNYSSISIKTVPYRIGHKTFNETFFNGTNGTADVVLITDLSGSMMWTMVNDSNGNLRNCSDPALYSNSTRRVSVAKCVDKDFVDIIMNSSTNRLWLVDFSDHAHSYTSTSSTSLKNYIGNYSNNPSGGTCICCAINLAYNILNANSSSLRNKYILVMSDGIPGYCCGRYISGHDYSCNNTGTGTTGVFNDCGGNSADCSGSDCNGAIASSVNASRRIHDILNTTVYSIGFGPVASCSTANQTLTRIAEVGNGSYYTSTNVTELMNFYRQIAKDIMNRSVAYSYQKINATGVNSTLYPSSYIKITYAPLSPLVYGKIPITVESIAFGNNITSGSFSIPGNVTVYDAKVTSYSSYYWTDNVTINGNQTYRLSDFGSIYMLLGDPYPVAIPLSSIVHGVNNVSIKTGISPSNNSGGSPDNRAIYTLLVPSSASYSVVGAFANGCIWNASFEDESSVTIRVPSTYSGNDVCSYNITCIYNGSTETQDAINPAVCQILAQLDPDLNGLLNFNIDSESLIFESIIIPRVPTLWGPI